MRLIKFLELLLFPDKYLHQAYVWGRITDNRDMLCVEIVRQKEVLKVDVPLNKFAWMKAAWILSKGD